jgi:hypothetical protein
MTTHSATTAMTTQFTREELRTLRTLRARYKRDRDLISTAERARLEFIRWLYQTERLVP